MLCMNLSLFKSKSYLYRRKVTRNSKRWLLMHYTHLRSNRHKTTLTKLSYSFSLCLSFLYLPLSSKRNPRLDLNSPSFLLGVRSFIYLPHFIPTLIILFYCCCCFVLLNWNPRLSFFFFFLTKHLGELQVG